MRFQSLSPHMRVIVRKVKSVRDVSGGNVLDR